MLVEKVSEYDQELPQSHTGDQPIVGEEEAKHDNSLMTKLIKKALSHSFPDKFSFTLPTAETSKIVSEYEQEIPQSKTADKLKFIRQFSESRLTMKVSNASKTCYEKVHVTATWKDILHIHRFSPSDF